MRLCRWDGYGSAETEIPSPCELKGLGDVVQVFKSHCAPEPPAASAASSAANAFARLTVAALKEKLKALDQPLDGKKVRHC